MMLLRQYFRFRLMAVTNETVELYMMFGKEVNPKY